MKISTAIAVSAARGVIIRIIRIRIENVAHCIGHIINNISTMVTITDQTMIGFDL
jgi:hypothetical protein